jgi:predicted metal-dependent enzyme (double-stranded beta helix superfamily)
MKADPGDGGREKARDCLARLLKEKDFVQKHCSPDHKPGTTLLYRDEELDFNVLAHCFKGGAKSPPHDHGTSWAIYGQALGHTNVEVWRRKDGARGDKQHGRADLEKIET